TFQVFFLTILMTGAGMGLVFLALHFWLVPQKRSAAETAAREYRDLTALLKSDEMKNLRYEAKKREEAGTDGKSILMIVDETATQHGLALPRSNPTRDGTTERVSVQFQEPAPLVRLLRYVAAVRLAKPTIEVSSFKVSKPAVRRGDTSSEELFTATVEFIDYSPP